MKRHAGLGGDAADLFDGLQRAQFVVGVHHGDEHGLGPQRAAHLFRIHDAVAADRQIGDVRAALARTTRQRLAGVQHGRVFDGAGDDVAGRSAGCAAAAPAMPQIAALSDSVPPLVKTISAGLRADERGHLLAGALDRAARALAEAVHGAGVAVLGGEIRKHLREDGRVHRRRGVVVKIDAAHGNDSRISSAREPVKDQHWRSLAFAGKKSRFLTAVPAGKRGTGFGMTLSAHFAFSGHMGRQGRGSMVTEELDSPPHPRCFVPRVCN